MIPSTPGLITSSFNQPGVNANGPTTNATNKLHTSIEMGDCSRAHSELLEHLNEPDQRMDRLRMDNIVPILTSVNDELADLIAQSTENAPIKVQELVLDIQALMQGVPDRIKDRSDYIVLDIESPELFDNSIHSAEPETLIQRATILMDFLGEQLGKLARNEFEGDLGRWASNLTISTVRTGLVTGTLTVLRQLIGFSMEKALQSNAASPLTRNVIGGIALAIGPVLNTLGAIRDECNGTANAETRLARLAAFALSIAAFAAAISVPTVLPALASFGPQMAFYTFAQDLVNLFCPTKDNTTANANGTAATGALNGALQFLSFTGMNYTAPHSGPGYVMAQSREPLPPETEGLAFQLASWAEQQASMTLDANLSVEARANQIVESLVPVLGHDVLRGVFNAGADVAGQVLGGEVMHLFQPNASEKGYRVDPLALRTPTTEQALDQLLSTNAIRTSMGQTLYGILISTSRYFSTLPIPKETVDHIANLLIAALFFVARGSSVYINQGSAP